MNRGEIRQGVRDILGDYTQGYWKDDELNRYIQIACDRHSQEALSVPITERTTILPGIEEYVLPGYFGEMRRVRWISATGEKITLVNTSKTKIENMRGSEFHSIRGYPTKYYNDAGRIGLYPYPDVSPLFAYEPPKSTDDEVICNTWQTVVTERLVSNEPGSDAIDRVTGYYSETIGLELKDSCSIYCGHISLLMRRNAYPVDGGFALRIAPEGKPEYELRISKVINTRDLGILPEWVHFDFTHAPLELDPSVRRYNITFVGDTDFNNQRREVYRDDGPQFAVNVSEDGNKNMYFQIHQYRQDLELDFYKNEVELIQTDTEVLELKDIYHRTIITVSYTHLTLPTKSIV